MRGFLIYKDTRVGVGFRICYMKKINNDKDLAISILNDITQSLKNDVGSALKTYHGVFISSPVGIGFFAIPRLIFPEIDNLGCYLVGDIKHTASNAISFMKMYFSKVDPEYRSKSAFIYFVYRHGLMHQHMPKSVSCNKKNIGWSVGISTPNTKTSHLNFIANSLNIDGQQFYEDFLRALELYKKDVLSNDAILKNLITAHRKMISPVPETELLKKPYIKQSDLDFLKDF